MTAASTPTSPQALIDLIRTYQEKWHRSVLMWLVAYIGVVIATVLIPLAIANAGALVGTPLSWVETSVALLALIVAAVAALDQLFDAGARWRAYMRDRDRAATLAAEIEAMPPTDSDATRAYFTRWLAILAVHDGNLPGAAKPKD
jgi:hypothetical protein